MSLDQQPTDDFALVHTAIDNITPGSQSNIADAIDTAHDWFTANGGTEDKFILLMSDGEPTKPGGKKNAKNAAIDAANAAKSDGITIITVGLQVSAQ